MKPSLIVHGGAWDIPNEAVEACKSGCHRALAAGWSILTRGGSALDAIEAAIMVLEAEREAWSKCKTDKHAAAHHRGHEQGTVGAVAMDRAGNLFAAISTGGTCCKAPGRVGDSPLIGCGCYADSEAGGVSCTGYGEAIMKIVMAKTAVDLLRQPATCVDASPAAPCDASTANIAAREAIHL